MQVIGRTAYIGLAVSEAVIREKVDPATSLLVGLERREKSMVKIVRPVLLLVYAHFHRVEAGVACRNVWGSGWTNRLAIRGGGKARIGSSRIRYPATGLGRGN